MGASDGKLGFKLLHSADWHLGLGFPGFGETEARMLTRQRLATVGEVLALGDLHRVDAIVIAGDVFDTPDPAMNVRDALTELLRERETPGRQIFLLPGNHDPLTASSVWGDAKFRASLPGWVHVVDRDDYSYAFGDVAVVHAVPCRRAAGQQRLVEKLPVREPGDRRIRIALLHGQVFSMEGVVNNFPIDPEQVAARGYDYLALGDTHALRLPSVGQPVYVYPGTPEPTRFGETEAGHAVVVMFSEGQRPPMVRAEQVGHFRWLQHRCGSMAELQSLASQDLRNTVLRLELAMALGPSAYAEAKELLVALAGDDVRSGTAACLQLDDQQLRLDVAEVGQWIESLPEEVREVALQLRSQISPDDLDQLPQRALNHLYRLVQETS